MIEEVKQYVKICHRCHRFETTKELPCEPGRKYHDWVFQPIKEQPLQGHSSIYTVVPEGYSGHNFLAFTTAIEAFEWADRFRGDAVVYECVPIKMHGPHDSFFKELEKTFTHK